MHTENFKSRNYRNYNPDTINNELKAYDWSSVYSASSANKAWVYMKEVLLSTLNKHAPIIRKRIKGKVSPWLDKNIKKEMNHRDILLRKARKTNLDTDWAAYKRNETM